MKESSIFFTILALISSASFAKWPAEYENIATSAAAAPADLAARSAGSAPRVVPPLVPTDLAIGFHDTGFTSECEEMILVAPEFVSDFGSLSFGRPACDFADNDFTKLYCADGFVPATIVWIDPLTCAETIIGTASNTRPFTGFAWDPGSGTMYGSTTDGAIARLVTVDLTTGASTEVGPMLGSPRPVALGIDALGDLYGYDSFTDSLHSFDKATGAGTLIGPLGFDAEFDQGMDFDHTDGTCYLFAFNITSTKGELLTCDVTTGATTLVGLIGSEIPGGVHRWSAAAILSADVGGCNLSLSITGTCPGGISVSVSGATPGGDVFFAGADAGGSFTIPGGSCAGTVVDLDSPTLLTTRTTDGDGNISLSPTVGPGSCGDSVQAVDGTTCCTSNVAIVP